MSKIIEALEKAKREGHLDTLVDAIDERNTVSGVGIRPFRRNPGAAGLPTDSRHRSRQKRPVPELSPETLAGLDPHIEPLHNPMSEVCEQYRSLRNRIERVAARGNVQVIAVTSSVKGEGKTLSATNLALVLAQDLDKKVLLVDADLRRPEVHQMLGQSLSPGLAELLEGRGPVPIRETAFFGLCMVTAGEAQGHPSELLAGSAFHDFLREQRSSYDFIIVDSPPINPISDVGFLTEAVDQIVMVVRAGKTHKGLIKASAASLPEGKLMGTLLNWAGSGQSGYGKGPDYSYGGYY